MKTKQSGVCELSPFGEMPAYTTSEKVNAHLGERYAGTKKRVGIIALLLAWAAPLPLAAEPMAGMEVHEETAQTRHQGFGKVVSVDRAKSRIKLAHEPIKSLGWSSMKMDFIVTDASMLDGLKAGDAVRFELGQSHPDDLIWVITGIERR